MHSSSALRELFETAVELPPALRPAFLDERCADADLRVRVERLLAADASAVEPFGGGAAAIAAAIGDAADAFAPGTRIGPYELVGVLGEGGSSTVFKARRDVAGVRQDVALKLLRRGIHSPDAQRAFRRERQALAQMRHPGIARLIDGGVTETGLAYIAIELVDGRPIVEFARTQRLDLRARLALFLQVCRAVEAAHRALIVHRDLKPSNVFVADDGQVKLLDFGIAKLLASEADETRTLVPVFTPAYAAPEQRDGGLITTATDVYALGILLGELVTGQRPSRTGPDSGRPGAAARTPSAQITGAEAPGVLPAPAPLTRRALRGDLDNIVMKAIENEPERRYASAGAFADDIARALDGRPVAAHPPSRLYRARKFVRRHRGSVAATLIFLLALLGAFGVALWQAKVARDAERGARLQAARARTTRDFLVRVFRASDPRIAQDKPRGEVTAKELLDAYAPRIDSEFAQDPDARLELLGVTASIYHALDDQERYQALHRRHLDLARERGGELSPVVIADRLDDAADTSNRNEFAAALRQLGAIDAQLTRAGLDDSELRARWWYLRGDALSADASAQAQRMTALKNAEALYARLAPGGNGHVDVLNAIGSELAGQLDDVQAAKYFARAIDIAERASDRDDAGLQPLYGNLAGSLLYQGDFDGAEAAFAKVADLARQTTGEHNHRYWVRAANYAAAVHQRGDRERALQMFAALLPLLPERPEPQQVYDAAFVREVWGRCLVSEGRGAEAIAPLEAVQREYGRAEQSEFDSRRVRLALAEAYDEAGRGDDALRVLRALLAEWTTKGAADFQPVLTTRERLGRLLLARADLDGAAEQFGAVLAQAHGRRVAPIALALGDSARLDLARGDGAGALAASAAAVAMFDHLTGFRNVRTGPYLWLIRSETLQRSGDTAGARDWAQRALEASRRYDDPSAASIRAAEALLRQLDVRR